MVAFQYPVSWNFPIVVCLRVNFPSIISEHAQQSYPYTLIWGLRGRTCSSEANQRVTQSMKGDTEHGWCDGVDTFHRRDRRVLRISIRLSLPYSSGSLMYRSRSRTSGEMGSRQGLGIVDLPG
jgi:hypothetical protein